MYLMSKQRASYQHTIGYHRAHPKRRGREGPIARYNSRLKAVQGDGGPSNSYKAPRLLNTVPNAGTTSA